jgi:hypothetical protein
MYNTLEISYNTGGMEYSGSRALKVIMLPDTGD